MQKPLKIFIGGFVLISLGLILNTIKKNNYGSILLVVGFILESLAILLYAYAKIKNK